MNHKNHITFPHIFLPGKISAIIPFCLFAKSSLHFKVVNKVVKRVAMGTLSLATPGSPATCQAVARAELSITSEGLACMPSMLVGLSSAAEKSEIHFT